MSNTMNIGPLSTGVPVPVPCLLTALFSTTWVLSRIAPHLSMDPHWAKRTAEMSMIAGTVSVRLLFVVINWESYRGTLKSVLCFGGQDIRHYFLNLTND
jgi:hypothetical protein